MNMNLKLGGEGGWDHVLSNKKVLSSISKKRHAIHTTLLKEDEKYRERVQSAISNRIARKEGVWIKNWWVALRRAL
jgi:hypothetical protein